MRTIKAVLIFMGFSLLAGCATMESLTNRVACTAAGDKAYFLSLYGPVGISAAIDQRDANKICAK